MEATETHGVWKETITDGYEMLVDTNYNIIHIKTPGGQPLRYELPEGITIDDVVRIREEARINFNI